MLATKMHLKFLFEEIKREEFEKFHNCFYNINSIKKRETFLI